MKFFLIIYTIITLSAITSCTPGKLGKNKKIKAVQMIEKLNGTWATYSSVYTIIERWRKSNDSTFRGSSIMLMNKDTLLNQSMLINVKSNSIVFTSEVKANEQTEFEKYHLIKTTAEKIVFNKTGSDDKLVYFFKSAETMTISIQSNEKNIESYNMKKLLK